MKKFLALCLALVMVFGLISVPKATKADEEVKPATEYTITVNDPTPVNGGRIWADKETVPVSNPYAKLWSEAYKGYVFDHWVIESGEYELVVYTLNDPTCEIEVKSDLVVSAVFKKALVEMYDITYKYDEAQGTVSGPKFAAEGATVKVEITPAEGFAVDKFVVKAEDGTQIQDVEAKYQFTMPAQPVTVTVTFKAITPVVPSYTITVNDPTPVNGGKIWADKETVPVSNPYAKLWSEAYKGYVFDHWVIESGEYELVVYTLNDPTCEIEVKSDLVVTAVFVASDYYFYLDPNNVTLNVGEQATIISYMSYNGGEGQPFDATGGSWKVEPSEGLKLVKGEGTGEYTVIAEAAGKYEITAITSTPDGGKHHAKATVVVEEPADYDAWISSVRGWLGSGYRVLYTIRVRNSVENPTFEVKMGESGTNRYKDNMNDFWSSEWACWTFYADPKPIEGKDYTEYYILVKFYVRHLNTKALVSVKNGAGETVKIRSFQSSANNIMGVVGDNAGHSMVEFLSFKGIMENNSAYTELSTEMVTYCTKALATED